MGISRPISLYCPTSTLALLRKMELNRLHLRNTTLSFQKYRIASSIASSRPAVPRRIAPNSAFISTATFSLRAFDLVFGYSTPSTICLHIGHDIFPTLLDIAGVALPRDRVIDGTSILPVLQGRPFQRSRPLYWRNRKETMRVAIRAGAWKMLCDSTRSTWELYNLAEDPGETMEQGQENPERFERMKATLIAYDNDVLDDGPAWWQQGSWKKSFPTEVVEKLQEDKPR